MPNQAKLLRRVRMLLVLFIVGLVLSGLTAFALETELRVLARWLGAEENASADAYTGFTFWIVKVRNGLIDTYAKYPFVAYGTDWLAFAHLILAVLFLGAVRDPIRNSWVITFGLIACVATFPLAFICGGVRGIPLGWQLIDCSFGVVGFVPLWMARGYVRQMERRTTE
jgi:hypothetical protein